MPSNLKSRPIEGYIADNAGNILRNVTVLIKEETPASGSVLIDSVKSDDDGYFITKPIKNGVYDIYESGIRIYRTYHPAYPILIPAYLPAAENIPLGLAPFSDFVDTNYLTDINAFRHYIQVEPETIDIAVYGNMFPLWDVDIQTGISGHPFELLKNIHTGVGADSRFTHTRFDVEYFTQLDAKNSIHKRIRWSGVPGLQFYSQTKIVIPLDYYSIVPNHAIGTVTAPVLYAWVTDPADGTNTTMKVTLPIPNTTNQAFYDSCSLGDILLSEFKTATTIKAEKFWGIVVKKDSPVPTELVLYLKMWLSSNSTHRVQGISTLSDINSGGGTTTVYGVYKFSRYHGFFSSIQNISQTTGERFCVSENLFAQDQQIRYSAAGVVTAQEEIYDYNGV
jgi:hypothetical protein